MDHTMVQNTALLGASFQGANLTEARFSLVKAHKCTFDDIDAQGLLIEHSKFTCCDFNFAHMHFSRIQYSNFRRTGFHVSDLCGAFCVECDFTNCDMLSTALPVSILFRSTFTRTCLSGSDFRWSRIEECDFSGANLSHAQLRRCDLRSVCLAGADLRNTDLRETILADVDLRSVRINSQTRFEGARFDKETEWPVCCTGEEWGARPITADEHAQVGSRKSRDALARELMRCDSNATGELLADSDADWLLEYVLLTLSDDARIDDGDYQPDAVDALSTLEDLLVGRLRLSR